LTGNIGFIFLDGALQFVFDKEEDDDKIVKGRWLKSVGFFKKILFWQYKNPSENSSSFYALF